MKDEIRHYSAESESQTEASDGSFRTSEYWLVERVSVREDEIAGETETHERVLHQHEIQPEDSSLIGSIIEGWEESGLLEPPNEARVRRMTRIDAPLTDEETEQLSRMFYGNTGDLS